MANLLTLLTKDPLVGRLAKIKEGDLPEREKLLKDYTPFIVSTVSKQIKRYIESTDSDEYIVGMEAFNEAIDKYENRRGGFIKFAELVINSRIIDYERKKNRLRPEISLEECSEAEMESEMYTNGFEEAFVLKSEMRELKGRLNEFGITFGDLIRVTPKHKDTRTNAIRAAWMVSENKQLKEEVMQKKKLPYSRVYKELGFSKKFLLRNHKYIIAAILVLNSNLETIKDYLKTWKEG